MCFLKKFSKILVTTLQRNFDCSSQYNSFYLVIFDNTVDVRSIIKT